MKKLLALALIGVFLCCTPLMAASELQYTKSGYLASVSEELLHKAVSYAVNEDEVALQKLLDTQYVFWLKAGVPVYIEDIKVFSGTVKIRPKGETVEVWTLYEAVEPAE
jgi:hypothetical protein